MVTTIGSLAKIMGNVTAGYHESTAELHVVFTCVF